MSHGYQLVSWTRFKKRYDLMAVGAVVGFLAVYMVITLGLYPTANPVQVLIRAFGLAAIVLLHFILAIGPLARLDNRYLPLLYNRRHLGVMVFLLAGMHGGLAFFWYHAAGTVNPFLSVFISDWGVHPGAFPFQAFGAFALMILFVMAATSHDFWLTNLTAPVWKTMHMLVYGAYLFLVIHVAFGVLQAETSPFYVGLLGFGAFTLIALHLTAAYRERPNDTPLPAATPVDGFIAVAKVAELPLDETVPVCVSGERVAVLRYLEDGVEKISALSGVCQHQNGPLAEGRFTRGCLTCPWHGFQYRPDSGASPAPFNEKVPTFNVRVEDGEVLIDPNPNPAGTRVEPVILT